MFSNTEAAQCHNGELLCLSVTIDIIESVLSIDLSLVLPAVMEFAAHRWYPIGLKLGYNDGQIMSMVKDIALDVDRLTKIVNCKKMGEDSGVVADNLLEACEAMSVLTAVQDKMKQLQLTVE